jgi:hypothetical protein
MPDRSSFRYGTGFRSLTAETREPVRLAVGGTLPSWLEGTLLRTGPAKFEVGARTLNHWFDGFAMLHRFAIADGGVTYANRFLKSKAFSAAEETGKISYSEFATDPCRTLFGRVAAMFAPKPTDNCNVNVSDYARETVAFTETLMPIRFSPATLETLGIFAYSEALSGQISTAHPHYDAKRACHYNYVTAFGMNSLYRICRIGDDGAQRQIAEIAAGRPSYMHSFGMSEDHLILTEFPLVVNPIDLRMSGKPFIRNYRWKPERGIVFHVVAKDTGEIVRTGKTDATFAFHHVNASTITAALRSMWSNIPTLRSSISFTFRGSAPTRRSPPPAGSFAFGFRWPTGCPSRERSWPTRRLRCRASITRDAPASPIATFGPPASRSKAISSIPSSRSTRKPGRSLPGTRRASIPASRCSSHPPPPRARTTAFCFPA